MANRPNKSGHNMSQADEKSEQKGGLAPYVVGGLFGVAVGLAASYFLDQHTSAGPVPENCSSSHGKEGGVCVICQGDISPKFVTPCCKQTLHRDCYKSYREHKYQVCPLCRQRW